MKLAFVALLACLFSACAIDVVPGGARRTPDGTGPRVVFDATRRPLAEIPQPNDVATFADPTSRTGRRISVSLEATTSMERDARAGYNTLEGWGTFAPITVAFEREVGGDPATAAIDLADVASRTTGDDPADDPFYVVDLTTGVPAILDVGKKSFPLAITQRGKYWANDPRASEDTVMFETVEEGPGLAAGAYAPSLDTDFDGVVDHPNVLAPGGKNAAIGDVISWYERETDTLILRPTVPLEEKREYAVVLTDRLKGPHGAAVRSPFPYVHHAAQRDGAEKLRTIFSDPTKKNYYGDVAGTGLDHVAFLWTFTTQPTTEDLRILRDGLYGRGPFARLAGEFPAKDTAFRAVGTALDPADEPPGAIDGAPACATAKKAPYVVKIAGNEKTFHEIIQRALKLEDPALQSLIDSLSSVDHIVVGSFDSPYFLGDPAHETASGRFELDFATGHGSVSRDSVQFWLAVPKARGDRKPFPVTLWAHGSTLHADEIAVRAGYFARQGQAILGINMPGHGLYLDAGLEGIANILFRNACLAPWVKALGTGRDHDLNGDGVPDSGGLLWTAHPFHTRDNIRQSIVDEMQAVRVIRSWDGVRMSDQDYDGDGKPNLAGDFDGDGVVDVGGPSVPITTAGDSFGGVLAMIHGAVDPNVVASAPISGGGGLTDVATRSALVTDSVIEQILSPLVVAVPGSTVPKNGDAEGTRCKGDDRSVRFVVNDLTASREVEIACLTKAELDRGKTVVLTNLRNREVRCARTEEGGRFRLPIAADVDDRLDLQIYEQADAVISYKSCELAPGVTPGRRVRTFEQALVTQSPVADPTKTCAAAVDDLGVDDLGCAQFRDRFYPVGSLLVAPQEGLGLRRQTPEFRRLIGLTQVALDAADPVNFAPYYALRPNPGIDGRPMGPRAVVAFATAADPYVPSATGYAFARAAGTLPFFAPNMATTHAEWAAYATPRALFDAFGGQTPEAVLESSGALEGVPRLGRSHAGPTCRVNYAISSACQTPPAASLDCETAAFDPDWLAEDANLWEAPHPATPLRLARSADVAVHDARSVDAAWTPRIDGAPFAADGAWTSTTPLLGVVDAWILPGGQHVFITGDPCKAFDDVVYYDNLLARFLATEGRDLYFLRNPKSHACLGRQDCVGMF